MREFWKQMNVRNRLNILKSETSIMESLFLCIFCESSSMHIIQNAACRISANRKKIENIQTGH